MAARGKTFALVRLRLTGLAFLLVIAGLVYLTVLLYQKAFTPVVHVTLKTDRIGNQLSAPADVKLRGLVVGTVRSVSSTGDGASIDLALEPSKTKLIPSNVQAQLLPKTLFGEKFVSLVIPPQPSGKGIREGAVIPQDRSSTSIETERVLNDLMPLLQSLKPEELSYTLNAVSGALRGRGDEIGANLEKVDAYLKQFNPQLPTLQKDMVGLADLADTYDQAAPDFLTVLDNTAFSSRSLVEQRVQLAEFLKSTSGFSSSAESLLRDNQSRLITLASSSLPSLRLYAAYAGQFPCILRDLKDSEPIIEKTFGGLQPGLHITLEVTQDQAGYVNGDQPRYADSRPAYCNPRPKQGVNAESFTFRDGYRDGGSAASAASADRAAAADPAAFVAGSPAQRGLLNAVVAPVLGVPAGEVSDLAGLLVGPMARGTKVGLA
jgi:phospholipid/cholesterol/gamma-HCH transport system substrate-binding protein